MIHFVILIRCCGSMSCVVCESYAVQLRPAVDVLVVPYSVRVSRYTANRVNNLTLILLKWRIWWAPNNACKWQMGFNLAFKGLSTGFLCGSLTNYSWMNNTGCFWCRTLVIPFFLYGMSDDDHPWTKCVGDREIWLLIHTDKSVHFDGWCCSILMYQCCVLWPHLF